MFFNNSSPSILLINQINSYAESGHVVLKVPHEGRVTSLHIARVEQLAPCDAGTTPFKAFTSVSAALTRANVQLASSTAAPT